MNKKLQGVIIGMGTDSGTSVGWTAHTELRNMVSCGLSPMEPIVAATRTNAEILGLDQLGMVAPGRSADFVVLEANALDDITNTRRISQVYLRGDQVDREALRAKFMEGAMWRTVDGGVPRWVSAHQLARETLATPCSSSPYPNSEAGSVGPAV